MPGALQEDLLDPLDGKAVSDLEIQRRLDALVTSGHEPVDAGVVFVVFLAPGLRSTLGTSSSEKDFAPTTTTTTRRRRRPLRGGPLRGESSAGWATPAPASPRR